MDKELDKIIAFLEKEIGLDPFTQQVRLAYVLNEAIKNKELFNTEQNRTFLKHVFKQYQKKTYDYDVRYGAFERSVYRYIEQLIDREYVDFHLSIKELIEKIES